MPGARPSRTTPIWGPWHGADPVLGDRHAWGQTIQDYTDLGSMAFSKQGQTDRVAKCIFQSRSSLQMFFNLRKPLKKRVGIHFFQFETSDLFAKYAGHTVFCGLFIMQHGGKDLFSVQIDGCG